MSLALVNLLTQMKHHEMVITTRLPSPTMNASMFDSMIHDLLSRHDPRQTNLPIKLADYESWQKLYTFDALQDVRYGQSFCNHFDIQDHRIYYERDWVRCDTLIRREWIERP